MSGPLIALAVLAAAAVQSLAGFGFALLLMPVLAIGIGLRATAPLVAIVSLVLNAINLIRNHSGFNGRELWRLTAASLPGVPIGIWALGNIEEHTIMRLAGVVLVLYAAYALLRPATAQLRAQWLAFPAGLLAGCLSGAYNTPAPPLLIYGSLRQWPKEEFRAALHALFLLNGILVVTSHLVARHVTAETLAALAYALPALAAGVALAVLVDRWLDGERFRTFVLVLILVLGFSLALNLTGR